MKSEPMILPPVVATDVALVRLPVRIQTRLERIRPPSSGAAGSRLNIASTPLTSARYMAMPAITFSKGLDDNRSSSIDSRIYGTVAGENIIGRSSVRFCPLPNTGGQQHIANHIRAEIVDKFKRRPDKSIRMA